MNVVVYPPSLISRTNSSEKSEQEARELAFGLVKVPKLECCGGRCSCPDHKCGCGEECGGCCADTSTGESAPSVSIISVSETRLQSAAGTLISTSQVSSNPSKGSCCS